MLLNVNGPMDSDDTDWATKLRPQIRDVSSSSMAAFRSFIQPPILAQWIGEC